MRHEYEQRAVYACVKYSPSQTQFVRWGFKSAHGAGILRMRDEGEGAGGGGGPHVRAAEQSAPVTQTQAHGNAIYFSISVRALSSVRFLFVSAALKAESLTLQSLYNNAGLQLHLFAHLQLMLY